MISSYCLLFQACAQCLFLLSLLVSMYRPGAALKKKKKSSKHPYGLAENGSPDGFFDGPKKQHPFRECLSLT